MARSIRGGKAGGFEYWGKRGISCASPGRITKKLTHGVERTQARQLIHQELQQL
jgi:hypothetical protein